MWPRTQPCLPSGGGTQCSLGIDFTPQSSRSGGAAAKIRAEGDVSGNAGLSLWTATGGSAAAAVERVRIGTDGNVGIGTTVPLSKLQVQGTVQGTLFSGSGASLTALSADNVSTGTLAVARGGTGATTLTANKVLVGSGTSAMLQPTNLHWDNTNSRLGIGTTQPTQALQVQGTILSSGLIDAGTQFHAPQGDTVSAPGYSWDGDTNTGIYRPAADTIGVATNGAERMRILSNGYIGVGTTNPQATLHVNGNIQTPTLVGMVCHFAMATAPVGWLKCNGAAVSRTTYAALFAAIGTLYGVGDNSTTFNVPDLRGEFLRGWDDGRGVDSGRVMGGTQTDAFQGHQHNTISRINSGIGTYVDQIPGQNSAGSATNGTAVKNPITDGINGTPRTAAETRPRNIALLACIKY